MKRIVIFLTVLIMAATSWATKVIDPGRYGPPVQGWDANLDSWAALDPSSFASSIIWGAGLAYSGGTASFAPTELETLTWGTGSTASWAWTFNVSGTDHTMTISSGSVAFSGTISAATYGSDGSVSDAELLYINTLSSNAQTQLNAKQAGDPNLTAIAGLTTAANKAIYWTGASAASLYDLTSAGRALLDDAAATNQRTTLGLAIGTDVQAYDPNLTAIAGLTTAANKLNYWTGAGTTSLIDLTAFARSILDDADEATFKATVNLEVGTDVQAYDAQLATMAGLTPANNQVILWTGLTTAEMAGLAQVVDTVYPTGWNGDDVNGLSRNAAYDLWHLGDTDDNGYVDKIGNNTNISGQRKLVSFCLADPPALYLKDTHWCLIVKTDAAFTITDIEATCDADPTTEIDADLCYATSFFDAADPNIIHVLDTTAGKFSSGAETLAVPAGVCVYVRFGASADAATTQFAVTMKMDYN